MQSSLRTELLGAYGALEQAGARLEEMSPERVLNRGYAMVKLPGGYAGNIGELSPKTEAELIMRGGSAQITIEKVKAEG